MLTSWLVACADPRFHQPPPASPATEDSAAPGGPTGDTAARALTGPSLAPTASDPCARAAGFDDWPGGRTLRLAIASAGIPADPVAPLTPGAPVSLAVSGAVPGEPVDLWVGDVCGLDCPLDRDGACFQPAGAAWIGSVVADAGGQAAVEVTPDPTWDARWLVFQASAPARAALSQASVDRIDGWYGSLGPAGVPVELSPLTLHGQLAGDDRYPQITSIWSVPLRPGVTTDFGYHQVSYDDDGGSVLVSGGAVSWPYATPVAPDQPATLWWFAAFDYGPGEYSLDITTAPLASPVDWYPDLDHDGYGSGTPIASAVPIPDASPNPLDCDDADPALRPSGAETCADGVDQDCDGQDQPCAEVPGSVLAPDAGVRLVGAPMTLLGTGFAAGDVDGDGVVDLVGLGYGGTAVFPVGRTDQRGAPTWLPVAQSAAIGDLTGDGVDDLVLGASPEVRVFAGPVLGTSEAADAAATVTTALYYERVAVGDVSGDGAPDLVLSDANGPQATLAVYLGPLTGAVTAPDGTLPVASGGLTRAGVALGDADGDGLADVWTNDVCLFLAPLDLGGASPVGCVDDGTNDNLGWAGLAASDVDGDGHGDLVEGDAVGARVLLGPLAGTVGVDAGTWMLAEDPSAGGYWWSGVTPDRDGDGAPELVLAMYDRVWTTTAQPGTVDPADGELLLQGDGTQRFVLGGDFDGDGVGDVAIGTPQASWDTALQTGLISVLLGPPGP